ASVLVPRTIGHVLNHEYDFYASSNYYDYAPLIYKVNDDLQPSSWMDNYRNYYHILTNSNGDSLISFDESNLGFDTENYADGDYRLIVEAFDAYGNSDIDSIDVKFRNGIISSVQDDNNSIPDEYILKQNYPNPFNSGTMIEFTLPAVSDVVLKVYDLLGREVKTIASGNYPKGTHRLSWNGTNELGSPVGSGVYICRLKAGNRTQFRKMVMIK
ncbi:MAG: T9SS type A sorting domain-containing protein, partial [bacterium]|nr:T9SS type A sorting domain-containing protein [bacterium]